MKSKKMFFKKSSDVRGLFPNMMSLLAESALKHQGHYECIFDNTIWILNLDS